MQEELLKVTTELQTVSSVRLCLVRASHPQTALKDMFCANEGSEDL